MVLTRRPWRKRAGSCTVVLACMCVSACFQEPPANSTTQQSTAKEDPPPVAEPPPTSEPPGARPGTTAPPNIPATASPPEPPPTPPTAAAADVVATFIRERMTQASVAFVAPDALARNEPGVAILRLAPSTVPPAELERELRGMLDRAGHGDAATVPIAPRMVATLTSDQPCGIELRNPPSDRAVAFGERTTWEWTVRPTRDTGPTLELTVALAAPVQIDGRETTYSVGVYRKRLSVSVGYRDRAADLLAWLGTSWPTMVAFGGSVGAFGAWLIRSRRRKPQRAGF